MRMIPNAERQKPVAIANTDCQRLRSITESSCSDFTFGGVTAFNYRTPKLAPKEIFHETYVKTRDFEKVVDRVSDVGWSLTKLLSASFR